MDLVPADGQQIHPQPGGGKGDLQKALHRVAVEQGGGAGAAHRLHRLRHRQEGAQLVVHQHHGHQHRVRPQGGGQIVHGDIALPVRGEISDLIPPALQLAAGLQHGGVLIGGGDDVLALPAVKVGCAEDGPVVPLGAAGGENKLLRGAAQGGGHIGPPLLHLSGGLAADLILGGGVAPALLHGRGGGLYRLRPDGSGGGVIQIVEHGDPSRMGPERAEKCEAPAIVYL